MREYQRTRLIEQMVERKVERARKQHTPKGRKIQNIIIVVSILLLVFLMLLGYLW